MNFTLTPAILISLVAAVLAVLFDWLPGLKTWYDKFEEGQKRGIMSLLLLIFTAVFFGLGCFNLLFVGWTCTTAGVEAAILLLLQAIAINQSVHLLTKPKSKALKAR